MWVAEVTQTQSGKKFGPVRKFQALTMSVTYAILLRYKDLSRFTHFLEDFGQKRYFFGSKTVFLGQEVHMAYVAYFTELNLQICDYAQKRSICRENCKYAFDESFHGHFCPRKKAAKFCHPGGSIS